MLKGAIKVEIIQAFDSVFFLIDKLHMHAVGLETTTHPLPCSYKIQGEEVAFELKLMKIFYTDNCIEKTTSIFLYNIILD